MTPAQLVIREQAFTKLQQAVTRFGDKASQINEHTWREPLLPLASRFGELVVALADNPDPLADEVATMASLLDDLALPDRNPADDEPGYSEEQAKAAIGNLVYALGQVRKALESIGQRPSRPELLNEDQAKVPAIALEDKLAAIDARLKIVADDVAGLKRDELGTGSSPQQRGLINFYVGQVEPRIALINTEVSGEIIDLAALARLTAFVATTTRSFAATVAGMVNTASATLKAAAPALKTRVTLFVSSVQAGTQAALGWIANRKPAEPRKPEPDQPFTMKEVKRRIVAGEAIPASWVPRVQSLRMGNTRLTDLAPLSSLKFLTSLSISHKKVSDLTPLAGLTNLTSLEFDYTRVSDLTPLSDLTALTSLHLDNTKVTDVTPLAGLTALKRLHLSETKVSDLAPLARLAALTYLNFSRTEVCNLEPLSGLDALTNLYLWDTQVSDLAPLAGLTALTNLVVSGTKVSDIAPLAGLTSLTYLNLSRTEVRNLSPLAGLTVLRNLELTGTKVSDLVSLSNLTALKSLHLRGTMVSDVAPLAGLTALTSLSLEGTQVSNLAPLASLSLLTFLNLQKTHVKNLVPLQSLPALTHLFVDSPPPQLAQDWPGWHWNEEARMLIHRERAAPRRN